MWTYLPMQLSYQLPVSCCRYSAVLWYTVQLSALRQICTGVMAVTVFQYCGTAFGCVSYSFPFFFHLFEHSLCFVRDVEQSNLITGLNRPRGFQEVEAPRFQDNQHMKAVSLSALRTGRLYPPGNIPGTLVCYRLSRPHGHSATGRVM
jgi:hypothetical protein